MRIGARNQIPEPVSAFPTGSETKQADRPERHGETFARDHAGVSALTARLTDLQKELEITERAKVEHIRSEYQMGAHAVDSAKTSHAIVDYCLLALDLPERAAQAG